eukprot:6184923-Pleurochrysis_carterae.AAC.1
MRRTASMRLACARGLSHIVAWGIRATDARVSHLVGAREEELSELVERDGGDAALHSALPACAQPLEGGRDAHKLPRTGADNQLAVLVVEHNGLHPHLDPLARPHLHEPLAQRVHLCNVAGGGADVDGGVVVRDGDARVAPPLPAHVALGRPHLAVGHVEVPHAQLRRAARHQGGVAAVEPLDGEGDVVRRRRAADREALLNAPDHQVVVVLAADASQ